MSTIAWDGNLDVFYYGEVCEHGRIPLDDCAECEVLRLWRRLWWATYM